MFVPLPPEEWWSFWPVVPLPTSISGYVDHTVFGEKCRAAGVNPALVSMVCERLENGAPIGARGAGRVACEGPNHAAFYEYGERSVDTLVRWLKADPPLICGPLTAEQVEGLTVRVNPLQTALKPNGDARVCVDQSHPRVGNPRIFGTEPVSVNASIDIRQYPCSMITARNVLWRLLHCGPDFRITKVDWTDAYKHCPVRLEDMGLNCTKLGSRYFLESSCTFGCRYE